MSLSNSTKNFKEIIKKIYTLKEEGKFLEAFLMLCPVFDDAAKSMVRSQQSFMNSTLRIKKINIFIEDYCGQKLDRMTLGQSIVKLKKFKTKNNIIIGLENFNKQRTAYLHKLFEQDDELKIINIQIEKSLDKHFEILTIIFGEVQEYHSKAIDIYDEIINNKNKS